VQTQLHQRIQTLDATRCALLDELETLNADDLTAKPLPGKWSILEVVEHMIISEREILQGLPEPSQLAARKRDLRARVTYPMVIAVLKLHIPVKTPAPSMVPQGNGSLADLRGQWDESQAWLQSFAAGLDRDGLGKAFFAHPIAGPLTLPQAVHMGQLHVDGHIRQIRRLQRLFRS
jgi:hypothetical protein